MRGRARVWAVSKVTAELRTGISAPRTAEAIWGIYAAGVPDVLDEAPDDFDQLLIAPRAADFDWDRPGLGLHCPDCLGQVLRRSNGGRAWFVHLAPSSHAENESETHHAAKLALWTAIRDAVDTHRIAPDVPRHERPHRFEIAWEALAICRDETRGYTCDRVEIGGGLITEADILDVRLEAVYGDGTCRADVLLDLMPLPDRTQRQVALEIVVTHKADAKKLNGPAAVIEIAVPKGERIDPVLLERIDLAPPHRQLNISRADFAAERRGARPGVTSCGMEKVVDRPARRGTCVCNWLSGMAREAQRCAPLIP